jgi:hypothetical protein
MLPVLVSRMRNRKGRSIAIDSGSMMEAVQGECLQARDGAAPVPTPFGPRPLRFTSSPQRARASDGVLLVIDDYALAWVEAV